MTRRSLPFSRSYMTEVLSRIEDNRRRSLKEQLEEICSFPSFVEIKVCDSFSIEGLKPLSPRDYVTYKLKKEIGGIGLLSYNQDTDITIKISRKSTYQFKRSRTSIWQLYGGPDHPYRNDEEHSNIYRDCEHSDICRDGCEIPYSDRGRDYLYVVDTYHAIVDAKDISKFIRESGEMWNGEDRIDPISDGKFHDVVVYVISEEVLPKGIEELVGRMKECRNKFLYLYVTKKGAEKFIEESKK